MARPKKKRVDLNKESLRDLLQTIWAECDEQRSKAIFQYNKWNRDVRENVDIALVGKTNNELLKIIDGAIGNRILVARLIKDYIGPENNTQSSATVNSGTVSEDAKDAIYDMIQKHTAGNNTEYIAPKEPKEPKESKGDPF